MSFVAKAIKSLFGGGSQPQPAPYVPPPDPQIAKDAISAANAAERARIRAKTGRMSTNTTGGEGDTSAATTLKTVLGS